MTPIQAAPKRTQLALGSRQTAMKIAPRPLKGQDPGFQGKRRGKFDAPAGSRPSVQRRPFCLLLLLLVVVVVALYRKGVTGVAQERRPEAGGLE